MLTLSGYKTYIAAALLAIVALVEGVLGIDIPGVMLDENWIVLLLNALGLSGLRAAFAKATLQGVIKGMGN